MIYLTGVREMKKKIGTVIDEELFVRVKQLAAARGQTFSNVMEKALRMYLEREEDAERSQKRNLSRSTKGALKVSLSDLKAVMEEKSVYELE